MNARITKYPAWGVGALVAVTLAIVAFVPDIEVRFTEDQARDAIRDHLPLEKASGDLRMDVTAADVDFSGRGDKGGIGITSDFDISGMGLAGSGEVDTFSRVLYDDGAFYLTDLQLDDLTITPSLATRAKLAALRKAWEVFLDEVGEDIRTKEGDEALAKFTEARRTLGPTVHAVLNDSLAGIPIYRLEGDAAKGAARLVLKDVIFTDREAIAILSPAQAMIKIATFAIGALVLLLLGWEWYRAERDARAQAADT